MNKSTQVTVDWYFDYISPFAYLQSEQLQQLPGFVTVRYRPILFAGLLNHWHQLGPAEIPTKREFTYQQIYWLANKHAIDLKFPPAHPFKSLDALRLTLACESNPAVVHALFRQIWAHGRDMSSSDDWAATIQALTLPDADEMTNRPEIKQQLRMETELAIERGIFGVPTFCVDEHMFWGFDCLEMFTDFLTDETYLDDPERIRLRLLPSGAKRL